jgi:FkbM family methyltransferase
VLRFDAWMLPEGEKHLCQWMRKVNDRVEGRLTYQYYKYRETPRWTRKERRVAVDVGAHVGLWSYWLARDFKQVVAFEPLTEHCACFEVNMALRGKWTLHHCALGDRDDTVLVEPRTPGSSGDTGIDPDAERSSLRAAVGERGERVDMKRLDEFELQDVDFLKIDCEGYELYVVRGAEQTLRRCKPCVIIEQKPEVGMVARYKIGVTDGVKFLESLGAKQRKVIQGDYIMSWD